MDTTKKDFIKKVATIQQKLKAPKSRYNSFGKYNYRSCEDILDGTKHLLGDMIILVTDEIEVKGSRTYVKATATITDGVNEVHSTAYAREAEDKKGMDESQITGTASSYARKYALNALLAIDDTQDADAQDNTNKGNTPAKPKTVENVVGSYGSKHNLPVANNEDTVRIETYIAYDDKQNQAVVKSVGFKFDPSVKKWFKNIGPEEEMNMVALDNGSFNYFGITVDVV